MKENLIWFFIIGFLISKSGSIPVKLVCRCDDYCQKIRIETELIQEWPNTEGVITEIFNANFGDIIKIEVLNRSFEVGLSAFIEIGDNSFSTNTVELWSFDSIYTFSSSLYNYRPWEYNNSVYKFLGIWGQVNEVYTYSFTIPDRDQCIKKYKTENKEWLVTTNKPLFINMNSYISPHSGDGEIDNYDKLKIVSIPDKGKIFRVDVQNNEEEQVKENILTEGIYVKTFEIAYIKSDNEYGYVTSFKYMTSRYGEDNSNEATITIIVCQWNCEICKYDNFCSSCKSGFYMLEDSTDLCYSDKEKPSNYYFSHTDLIFRKCHDTCNTCLTGVSNDKHNCNECNEKYPYYMINNTEYKTCYNSCPELNLVINGVYQLQQTYSIEGTYTCLIEAPPGYYLDINISPNAYKQCDKNCKSCINVSTHCTACNEGYINIPSSSKCIVISSDTNQPIINESTISSFLPKSQIITNEYKVEVYPTSKPIEPPNYNISSIDFSSCEKWLRSVHNIPEEEELIIAKFDIYQENSNTPKVQIQVYFQNYTEINIDCCKDEGFTIKYPITNIDPDILSEAREYLEKEGIDRFNPKDDFFNDLCYPYTAEGKDMIWLDRRNDLFINTSFCDRDCQYEGINYSTNQVICNCKIIQNFNEEQPENTGEKTNVFKSSIISINIEVTKCLKKAFSDNQIYTNVGFIFSLLGLSGEIVLLVLFFKNGMLKIMANIQREWSVPPKRIKITRDIFYNQSNNHKNIITKIDKGLIIHNKSSITSLTNSNRKNENTNSINNQDVMRKITNNYKVEKEKYIMRLINIIRWVGRKQKIETAPYYIAVNDDKRNFFQMLYESLKQHMFLLKIFTYRSPFEAIELNVSLFLFSVWLSFTINALFYSEDLVSLRYKNELTFFTEILRSIYSCWINTIWISLLNVWSNNHKPLYTLLFEVKDKEKCEDWIHKYLKKMRRKLFLFYFIEFIGACYCFIYLTCFCYIYKNSKMDWFKNGWVSIIISVLTSAIVPFVIGIIQWFSIRNRLINMYNINIFIQRMI